MHPLRAIAALLCVLLLILESEASADPGSRAPASPSSAAESAVRKLLEGQVAAWNRGDLEGYMSGYWRSPQLSFYSGGSVTVGWQPTLDRYRHRYQGAGKAMGHLVFSGLQVEILSGDAALARGGWQLTFAGTPPSRGLFTVLLRRLPDGWRVVHDHSSSE